MPRVLTVGFQGIRRGTNASHAVCAPRGHFGQLRLGAAVADRYAYRLRHPKRGFGGQLEDHSAPVVSPVDGVEVTSQAHPDRMVHIADAHFGGPVVNLAHRGRNPVRRHMRRAIGPINPTSSRNAASGANPRIWVSRRCALLRAIRRAAPASSPTRRYWTRLVNR